MEWAEELKMSIKKVISTLYNLYPKIFNVIKKYNFKTARKGRRSKSRDVLKGGSAAQTTSSSVTSKSIDNLSASSNAHLSIDITLDQSTLSPSTSSPSNAGATGETSTVTKSKRPAVLRRISGGWAETSIGKSLK